MDRSDPLDPKEEGCVVQTEQLVKEEPVKESVMMESYDIGYDSEFRLLCDGGEMGSGVHEDVELQAMLAQRCGYLRDNST